MNHLLRNSPVAQTHKLSSKKNEASSPLFSPFQILSESSASALPYSRKLQNLLRRFNTASRFMTPDGRPSSPLITNRSTDEDFRSNYPASISCCVRPLLVLTDGVFAWWLAVNWELLPDRQLVDGRCRRSHGSRQPTWEMGEWCVISEMANVVCIKKRKNVISAIHSLI